MKNWVNGAVWWKCKFVGHFANPFSDSVGSKIFGGQFEAFSDSQGSLSVWLELEVDLDRKSVV